MMRIPKFWAAGKARSRTPKRQLTVQRWGWSDESQYDAQAMADTRAAAALASALSDPGQKSFSKREPKRAYNGAEGVPIREEIIESRGPDILTRNSYGALCLNTPDVLFVDIDTDDLQRRARRPIHLVVAVGLILAWFLGRTHLGSTWVPLVGVYGIMLGIVIGLSWVLWRPYSKGAVGFAQMMLKHMVKTDSQAHWRLYETPRGARLLAMHATFEPTSASTQDLMANLLADRLYARMCLRQDCFRARVSPKPWRLPGIIRLRGPVWPLPAEKVAERARWVEAYESASQGFASCLLVDVFGRKSNRNPRAEVVQAWHDQLCQATSKKPLA